MNPIVMLSPLDNINDMLESLYETSMKVGPKLGVVALILAILAGVFIPGKDPKQHWFKCIGIGLGVVFLLNIGYVIGFFEWLFFQVLGVDGHDTIDKASGLPEVSTFKMYLTSLTSRLF